MRAKTTATMAIVCLTITSLVSAESRPSGGDRHDREKGHDNGKSIVVQLRETQSPTETVQPGETITVASACGPDEAVVGGGPTGIPDPLTIVFSTLFFDVTRNGWQVQYRNEGDQPVVVSAITGALCIHGRVVQTSTQPAP